MEVDDYDERRSTREGAMAIAMARYRRGGKEDMESAAPSNVQLDLTPQAWMH